MKASLCVWTGGFLSLWGMLSCSDSRTASTEVENELTLALEGVAATGAACQLAPVEFIAPDGAVVARDTTDSAGVYQVTVQLTSDRLPLLVRVDADSLVLYTLMATDSVTDLFALANPITSLVVRRSLGQDLETYTQGFTPPDRDSMVAIGQQALKHLFGEGVAWENFYSSQDFRPYVPGRPSEKTSADDALLHTLGDQARTKGQSLDRYMDSLFDNPPPRSLFEEDFRFQLAANMARLGVDSAESVKAIQKWRPDGDPDMEDYYRAMRGEQQQPPPDSGSPVQGISHAATDRALEKVPTLFTGDSSGYAAAMNHLASLSFIIRSSTAKAMDALEKQALSDSLVRRSQPLAQKLADFTVDLACQLEPGRWPKEEQALTQAMAQLLQEKVLQNFDLVAYVSAENSQAYYEEHFHPWDASPAEQLAALEALLSTQPTP